MSDDLEMVERTSTSGVSRRIDRRALIQRSAAVGLAAWTAPVIIGTVASPAGAVTLPPPPCGCNNLQFNASNCNFNNQGTECNENPNCEQSNALLANCFSIACNTPTTGEWTITYTCQQFTNCTPGCPNVNVAGGDVECAGPDLIGGPFGPWYFNENLHNGNYNQFSVYLNCCGEPACPDTPCNPVAPCTPVPPPD